MRRRSSARGPVSLCAPGRGALRTVAEARREALRLLARVGTRSTHVAGVAAAAELVSSTVPAEDVELLIAAAWLHDIGYAPEFAVTAFHPLDGARHLRSSGANERLCQLVANHTHAWVEAEARGLAGVLAEEFPPRVVGDGGRVDVRGPDDRARWGEGERRGAAG